jgi:hypothetical protein
MRLRGERSTVVTRSDYPPPDPPITLAGGMAAVAMGFADSGLRLRGPLSSDCPLVHGEAVVRRAHRAGRVTRPQRPTCVGRLQRTGPLVVVRSCPAAHSVRACSIAQPSASRQGLALARAQDARRVGGNALSWADTGPWRMGALIALSWRTRVRGQPGDGHCAIFTMSMRRPAAHVASAAVTGC